MDRVLLFWAHEHVEIVIDRSDLELCCAVLCCAPRKATSGLRLSTW